MPRTKPIALYARMWPRELFACRDGKLLVANHLPVLRKPGVYVLYRENGEPYYVGQAQRLLSRLWHHATQHGRYYDFWRYFSFFVVEDPEFRSQLEGALIAAMPTANGAKPKIKKVSLPNDIKGVLHDTRYRPI